MSIQAIITTIVGSFLLPFFIRLFWGRLANRFGGIGGVIAAIAIVGTIWIINHGMKNHLIQQSGSGWIDMAWAAAIGIFTASAASGGKIKKSFGNISAALVGGIVGAIVLAFFM